MTLDTIDHNRLLLEIDKTIQELNRKIINPKIPELRLEDLCPVMEMVARARSDYLTKMFDLAASSGDNLPSMEEVEALRDLRKTYEELVEGAKAIEVAIERGYLDVLR